ncbi:MAG: CapA family protein [Xenococcaceae cyanobacterium MO_234.B1]|nr:CapA family protein [Xenococcaceae cyanobacterium MO_234.B1]
METAQSQADNQSPTKENLIVIFLGGDVMTGRGIDQILSHPSAPFIPEFELRDAREYVRLAEEANGSIPTPVSFSYIWGNALEEWERVAPDVKLINLETSITLSNDYWWGKGINYRMNPENIGCLTAAKIDCCSLANNHVLDWGYSGLVETIATLKTAQIQTAGAGQNRQEAETPAIIEVKKGQGRAIAFSFGVTTSGIPLSWAADKNKPGINLLPDLSERTVRYIQKQVERIKQPGDVVIASIHWGGNWGYEIPFRQIEFAHQLIDHAGVDLIHGHSSHHVKGLEIYREHLIIYGCGDLLDDYEGIGGYEAFRDDLGLMYFATLDSERGKLVNLQMIPTQIKHFRVQLASTEDLLWLRKILNREGKKFGTQVQWDRNKTLTLEKLDPIPSSRGVAE